MAANTTYTTVHTITNAVVTNDATTVNDPTVYVLELSGRKKQMETTMNNQVKMYIEDPAQP